MIEQIFIQTTNNRWFNITFKYNGNDALTIATTGEATFASNVLL
jgi:hypothetical protein